MAELDRTVSHKSVMSIRKFTMDIDEISHLVYQDIHGMEVIVDTSDEGDNEMNNFFVAYF